MTSIVDRSKKKLATNLDSLVGKHDDGREGAVLTKIAQGKLVRVPFIVGPATGADGTLGTVTRNGTVGTNPDGSNINYQLTVNAGVNGFSYVEQTLWGRVVGIRFRRNASSQLTPFAVIVDGRVRKVRTPRNQSDFGNSSSTDYESLVLVADDLGDGPHTVRILLTSDAAASGASARSVVLLGWIAEADKGYREPSNLGVFAPSVTVPTATTVLTTTAALGAALVRKLQFHNPDAAPHTVTLRNGSSAIFKVLTMAAGTSAEHDFGAPFQPGNIYWSVDSGTSVICSVQTDGSLA